jgi:hypothetical protein
MALADLQDYLDPTFEAEKDPEAYGPYERETLNVDDETGRRVISEMQPKILDKPIQDGLPNVHGFLTNLGSNVEDFAKGTFLALTYPVRHPVNTYEATKHPIDTGTKIAGAMYDSYKENYTPHPDENVPQMLARRFYEKPFDTLMDASLLAQVATGGLGLATRAATAGTRGLAEGGRAAEALAVASGAPATEVGQVFLDATRNAAKATKTIDFFENQTARAKLLDPINIAVNSGEKILNRFAPEVVAGLKATQRVTDGIAERSAIMSAHEAKHERDVHAVFEGLNEAEKMVFRPYVSGRVNFERPISEQLMTHTGEWVPLKGDTIRPDALEAARQKYLPLQQELEYMRGLTPDQVKQTAMEKAFNDAHGFLGDNFDPFHPEVQSFITESVNKALVDNMEHQKRVATGEMRTSLDIAKERKYRGDIEAAVKSNMFATARDAEAGLPRPTRTTPEEAVTLMGPQGGMYFPHSAEVYTREQSTISNILERMGEASPYKENTYALYSAGVMEHQDPINQLLRAYSSMEKGKAWTQMSYEAAEDAVKAGTASRQKKTWNWKTDPDVIKGTHQPFHPGLMLTDDLVEEHGQHMLTRLMETIDQKTTGMKASEMTIDHVTGPPGSHPSTATGPRGGINYPAGTPVGQVNFADIMHAMVGQADKGDIFRLRKEIPLYKIPTALGHSFKTLRDSMEPSANSVIRAIDGATQWWNWTNLNVRVSRVVNNIVGNTGFAAMMGVHPFTPRGLTALTNMGIAMGNKAGLLTSERSGKLAKVFDLPGIRSGGLQLSLNAATGTVGHKVQTTGSELGMLGRAATAPVRMLGNWAAKMQQVNGNVESAFRGAALFYELSDNATTRVARMTGHMGAAMDLAEKIDGFAKAGATVTMKVPEYRAGLRQVNRFFNNYERTTPLERMMFRRLTPYYKFFKHSTDLITRYPFEHPLKGQVARQLGQIATEDLHQQLKMFGLQWNRDVPSQFQDSIPISAEDAGDPENPGKKRVWVYSTKGLNPFSQMDGHLSEQMVQMMNPVIKVALEQALGVNLFTRERYRGAMSSYTGREIDPKTGGIADSFERPSFAESFLRSFWPYQTVRDMVSQGRVPTDTASLISMATNSPEAWQIDNETGFPRRQKQYHPLVSFGKALGGVPHAIEPATEEQKQARKGITNDQLNTLYQRYPEHRQEIDASIARHETDVYNDPAYDDE